MHNRSRIANSAKIINGMPLLLLSFHIPQNQQQGSTINFVADGQIANRSFLKERRREEIKRAVDVAPPAGSKHPLRPL